MGLKESLQDVCIPVYFLVMLFGISSWIDINGIFVELPLMVNVLPEGWDLPSYIVLLIQFANIGPLAYTIGHKLAPSKIKEWPVVYIIITIGAVACLLLIFFWDYTSYIGGEEHSTALLTLTAFLALVDCTSSVVYLPYMAYFKEQYLSAFYIGEGLSGLIPGFLGLAQGVGGDAVCVNTSLNDNDTEWGLIPEYPPARFTVEVFFLCMCLLICVSGISFSFLHFAPYCQKEKISNAYAFGQNDGQVNSAFELDLKSSEATFTRSDDNTSKKYETTKDEKGQLGNSKFSHSSGNTISNKDEFYEGDMKVIDENQKRILSTVEFVVLMIYLGFVNGMTNGVLPSTLSYSCLPYGNDAYGYASRISTVANPLACFFALFVPRVSMATLTVVVTTGTAMCVYQLYLAGVSPTPPLQDETAGVFLVVASYVILIALFSYAKVAIATKCRDDGGRMSLLWCGGVTQIGSLVGAIISFVCINVYDLLESAPPCPA